LGIVNDILDFSKIEAGKMEIIPVEYQLSSVLNDLVNMIQARAKKKGLKCIAKADPNIPSILFGDEIRIKQIITNILTNAVKYTEKGSVTLDVDYKEKGTDSIILIVKVTDTGIGIKPEDLNKLFNAFERIEEERNRTIEGTGLGMNITQQLLSLMGSKLTVDSVYGEGSTFSFELEQKIISREPIGDFEEAFRRSLSQHKEYHVSFTAPDARILVVDDTVMNLTVVKGLLKQTQIKIDTAESGYDCLEMVQKNNYDLIFLDHRMPGMDGIETLKEMKDLPACLNADTPVISLTANAISGAREQYIAAGFKDYLTKPINSIHLENMLVKYLPKDKVHISDESTQTSDAAPTAAALPEWLTKVEGLDTAEGINHCGGEDAYLEALTVFAQSIASGADDIEGYYKSGDWKNYTTKVHALKSSSRVIGALELSERAKRLEDAGNSGYIDEIQQDTEPLLKLYRSYTEKLAPLIQTDEDDSDKPLIDPAELSEAFDAMKDVAASFDYDSLMFIFQSLDEYKLPDNEAERYKQLKDAATKLDWEKINNLLQNAA
ncbi:MAG: response regulator, partial [Selenomonadaceae bacterium]|nr:response regulator [Selenomonadaceae bacterium]